MARAMPNAGEQSWICQLHLKAELICLDT